MTELIGRVKEYCRQEKLLQEKDRIVVGLSGGADSVCLLRMLAMLRQQLSLTLVAVHVHHGIRKETADRDKCFAEALCRELGVPCRIVYADIPVLARREHLTLEEAGRSVRYQAFEAAAAEYGCSVIAVAHHMDDQAETMLMNLLRGSGLRGSGAIAPVRSQGTLRVIRPLLCVRKQEIQRWLEQQGAEWCEDETNAQTEYLRSRVRNLLLKELECSYNEQAVAHLCEAAESIREADAYIEQQAYAWMRLHLQTSQENGTEKLPVSLLQAEPPIIQSYILRLVIGQIADGLKDISRRHIQAVLHLLEGDGGGRRQLQLPQGLQVVRCYDTLLFCRSESAGRSAETAGESCRKAVYTILQNNHKKTPQNCCVNWFDYDTIKNGLLMRRRQPGDRICIHADGRTQKLSDFMINAKIPADRRKDMLVLADGSDIIWIPGYRMAEDRKVTEKTRMVLQVRLEAEE